MDVKRLFGIGAMLLGLEACLPKKAVKAFGDEIIYDFEIHETNMLPGMDAKARICIEGPDRNGEKYAGFLHSIADKGSIKGWDIIDSSIGYHPGFGKACGDYDLIRGNVFVQAL